MNYQHLKNTIIITIALFLIGLGLGFYLGFISNQPKPPSQLPSPTENTATTTVPTFKNTYVNSTYNFSLEYPDDMKPKTSFSQSYLLSDNWNLLTAATSTGDRIIDITVPNSDDVTSGELRIGASRNPESLANCLTEPDYLTPNKRLVNINGNEYTLIQFSDAAMNHYSEVYAYRLLKNNTCFAIDVLVFGTNPEVYDPPRIAPFIKDFAFSRLNEVLQTLKVN
ncbi:MAG: hypothetical protein PHW95_03060 [Patescibacteria group bacterium]|nr:hypothetical protein [Patescibacteria group bacterium]